MERKRKMGQGRREGEEVRGKEMGEENKKE